jgi:AcrR family transcriptional regulator
MSSNESETRRKILEATLRLMEQNRGQGVRMSDIAAAAKVSRQALYLHFSSRAELLIATTNYGDEIYGLTDRLQPWREAAGGLELLKEFVKFWGNYIPEIYGIAKALMETRETDDAANAAWNERMATLQNGCRTTIIALERDGMLASEWDCDTAGEVFWGLLSVRNWELFTNDCGWSTEKYVSHMQTLALRAFVKE